MNQQQQPADYNGEWAGFYVETLYVVNGAAVGPNTPNTWKNATSYENTMHAYGATHSS